MQNIIQTFEPNETGRDFVIGDLHGSLTCFENLLVNIGFDKKKDRMFSVGDLVDRGPDSLGTLRLLREGGEGGRSWFYATLSNHEQMMLEAFNGGRMGQYWYQNGGDWGMETWNVANALQKLKSGTLMKAMPIVRDEDMEVIDLLKLVEELPFLITLNHKNGKKFHIIHAELPPYDEVTDALLADPAAVHELATQQTSDGDCFLWGRNIFYSFYKADLSNRDKIIRTLRYNHSMPVRENLSHIISGHTIVQRPITLLGQTNIDTGAYGSYGTDRAKIPKWAALTCIDLDTWTFYQATETAFREVEPFEINKADLT
jgi:hypothetical protein